MSPVKTQIFLSDIRLYAFHGVMPQERQVGGWYTLNVLIDYDYSRALVTDDVADTLDYSAVLEVAKREMSVASNLLEHAAGRIASALIDTFPDIEMVEVRLRKDNPPMGADTSGGGVLLRLKNDKTCRKQ
jgi:dihydroneopterin aldolase